MVHWAWMAASPFAKIALGARLLLLGSSVASLPGFSPGQV